MLKKRKESLTNSVVYKGPFDVEYSVSVFDKEKEEYLMTNLDNKKTHIISKKIFIGYIESKALRKIK